MAVLPTKYARQIRNARHLIVKDGTVCTWIKSADTTHGLDTSPEYPSNDPPVRYPNTPIALYPQKRQSLQTVLEVVATGSFTQQLFAVIPGDVPFEPEEDDAVELTKPDGTIQVVHVSYLNVTKPDMYPIVYEVGFK